MAFAAKAVSGPWEQFEQPESFSRAFISGTSHFPPYKFRKLNNNVAKGMASEFAPDPSLHTGYHPHFGHYSLPVPPAPDSQLIPERAFPPSHLSAAPFASHVPSPTPITPSPMPSSPI